MLSELPVNQIICGDALEIMTDFPSQSVKLIVIDPPYARFHNSSGEASLGDFKILEIYFRELAQKCKRILTLDGAVFFFCDYRTYPCLFYGVFRWLKPSNLIIWRKDFLGPGIVFRPLHELIVYCPNDETLPPKDRHVTDIWEAARVKNRGHPFAKPKKLYRTMIKNCSDVGDIVLDPFCGSAMSLVVAHQLKRKWIGIDIEPKYVELAKKNIDKFTLSKNLEDHFNGELDITMFSKQ